MTTEIDSGLAAAGPHAETLRPVRTLNGLFDGYCHVCWEPVYCLWVDKTDPGGKCPDGHTKATDCPNAMNFARNTATFRKLRKEMDAVSQQAASAAAQNKDHP